jgi:type IV pilus assembly protein PilW
MKTLHKLRRHGGFSIVELMASVVIGMLAVAFATKLMVKSETEKSASVGGSEVMQNGMLAMFSITNDAEQAGWGLNDELVNGCNTMMKDSQGFELPKIKVGGIDTTPLAAVLIQNNGDRSDQITLLSGSALSGVGNVTLGADFNSGTDLRGTTATPFNFLEGDVLLIAPEKDKAQSNCTLAQLADLPTSEMLSVAKTGETRFNDGSALMGNAYHQGNARIFNLGRAEKLSFHTWSVTDGVLNLRATDLPGTATKPQSVISNIVAIKAQYGFDTRPKALFDQFQRDGLQVMQWSSDMVNADGVGVAGDMGDYQRVAAVRIAVIARSSIPEKPDPVSKKCTATTVDKKVFETETPRGVPPAPVSVKLDITGDTIDWTCYKYRAFETIVPIRNAGWRP